MPEHLLIYGAPEGSADLFHVIPTGIIDPFLYLENGSRKAATVSVLDADKVREHGVEILDPYVLGRDELLAARLPPHVIEAETSLRACRELGIERALVPFEFPAGVADHLRAGGLEVSVDPTTSSRAGAARRPPSSRASAGPSAPRTPRWRSPRG